MAGIVPIPNTRVSNLLLRQRLTQQYQGDQLDLFRLQEQISTGQRIILPSDDAPAALRSIALQRLLERKGQLESNIQGGQHFLSATDTALTDVAKELADLKGATLGVAGTIATQADRDAVISQVNGFLDALLSIANRQLLGRHLFAGSQASQEPYSFDGDNVVYHGDDNSIRNYSDLGVLFASNATGQSVFGGISSPVAGGVDLNPQLHAETQLSTLRGGRGISPDGAFAVSDGTNTSIIDLSNARTVGDVVRLIQENPPPGRSIEVAITGQGLTLALDAGNILVNEVGNGSTARELGILEVSGALTKVGDDLDPRLLKTTRLDDLLGAKARAVLKSGGNTDNNDIRIEASANGTAFDGVTVTIADGGDIGATATVSFDAAAKTLTIFVDNDGETSANQVVDAINLDGNFTATLDPADTSSAAEAGGTPVTLGATAVTAGGIGVTLDQTSGIRVVNGGKTIDISFEQAETVEDLLNILNGSDTGLLAEINDKGTGINVRSRLSGNDFQIGEVGGGLTATQLGIRTYTEDTKLSGFNYGVGVPAKDDVSVNITAANIEITAADGQTFGVDLSLAATLADVINTINLATTGNVTAQLDSDSTGIELLDNTEGLGRLTVTQSGADISINGGIEVSLPSDDFAITSIDGQIFRIDLGSAKTVGDVLDVINTVTGGAVTAQLAESGNGIELEDNTVGGGALTVTSLESSQAAEYIGLVGQDQTSNSSLTDTLTGVDRNYLETDSVFNTLIRLRNALQDDDINAIERAVAKVDGDVGRVTFARAEVGARNRALEISRQSLQVEEIQLRSALSDQIDVDLVEAISQLTARQISLEASLRSSATILQLSLLNFI